MTPVITLWRCNDVVVVVVIVCLSVCVDVVGQRCWISRMVVVVVVIPQQLQYLSGE